jgi:hypothetical protein
LRVKRRYPVDRCLDTLLAQKVRDPRGHAAPHRMPGRLTKAKAGVRISELPESPFAGA